jgi:hypothetical protein
MPLFRLTTIERWEHKVDYPLIEAATMEEAFAKIKAGDQEYLCQESIPEGDEVLRVWAADDETDSPLPIPAELENEPAFMDDRTRKLVIQALFDVQAVIQATYGPDDEEDGEPEASAADVFEMVCGLEIAIDEALEALQPCATP